MLRRIALLVLVATTTAEADPVVVEDSGAMPTRQDLATTRSQIGWGATMNPDRVTVTSEGGWNGADQRAVVSAVVETTLVTRASVFASTSYGGLDTNPRPALGVAYQVMDPRRGRNGARISLSYKPDGFTEPEGEIESVLVLSRRFGSDSLRAMFAYGQDPEGRESDGEIGTSYLHLVAQQFIVGGTVRYRHALALKVGEPVWDVIGGAIGGYAFGRARVEVLLGDDTIEYATVRTGIVGLLSVGADL